MRILPRGGGMVVLGVDEAAGLDGVFGFEVVMPPVGVVGRTTKGRRTEQGVGFGSGQGVVAIHGFRRGPFAVWR